MGPEPAAQCADPDCQHPRYLHSETLGGRCLGELMNGPGSAYVALRVFVPCPCQRFVEAKS